MSSARVGAFAQRVARTIVQHEVTVAQEGDDMKVAVFPRLHLGILVVNVSFPSSLCLGPRLKSPYA